MNFKRYVDYVVQVEGDGVVDWFVWGQRVYREIDATSVHHHLTESRNKRMWCPFVSFFFLFDSSVGEGKWGQLGEDSGWMREY